MFRFLAVTGLVVGLTVVAAPAAVADEITCRGTIGATTVDNLRVPDGARCTLNGTRVQGTINVGTNSVLDASGVRVIGNVQAEGSRKVVVDSRSTVGGSVQVVQGGAAAVIGSEIGGDILYDDQDGTVKASRNDVGGDIQAFQNTGGVTISRNHVDGNLQCKANRPAPTGGGNLVEGNKEDQCARL